MNEPHADQDILEKFKALYKSYAPGLIFYAAKFVDADTAEDFVQDVFLKVWNKRAFLYWEEGLASYLYHAVRHACLDYLKHLEIKASVENNVQLRMKIEELYYSESPAYAWNEDSRVRSIFKAIERLPDKCREIFIMAYVEERKAAEISAILNISKRTVEAQLYKGLKFIRAAVGAVHK